jgi:hypothetical protein
MMSVDADWGVDIDLSPDADLNLSYLMAVHEEFVFNQDTCF